MHWGNNVTILIVSILGVNLSWALDATPVDPKLSSTLANPFESLNSAVREIELPCDASRDDQNLVKAIPAASLPACKVGLRSCAQLKREILTEVLDDDMTKPDPLEDPKVFKERSASERIAVLGQFRKYLYQKKKWLSHFADPVVKNGRAEPKLEPVPGNVCNVLDSDFNLDPDQNVQKCGIPIKINTRKSVGYLGLKVPGGESGTLEQAVMYGTLGTELECAATEVRQEIEAGKLKLSGAAEQVVAGNIASLFNQGRTLAMEASDPVIVKNFCSNDLIRSEGQSRVPDLCRMGLDDKGNPLSNEEFRMRLGQFQRELPDDIAENLMSACDLDAARKLMESSIKYLVWAEVLKRKELLHWKLYTKKGAKSFFRKQLLRNVSEPCKNYAVRKGIRKRRFGYSFSHSRASAAFMACYKGKTPSISPGYLSWYKGFSAKYLDPKKVDMAKGKSCGRSLAGELDEG